MQRIGVGIALLGLACASGGTPSSPARDASGSTVAMSSAARELSTHEQTLHVLSRLAFGPRPGDVERVKRVGVDRWIEAQLHPARLSDTLAPRLAVAYPSLARTAEELLRENPPPQVLRAQARRQGDTAMSREDSIALRQLARQNRAFVTELLSARVARAVASERQLDEVMVDFWLNHFNVFIGKGQLRYYLPDYEREAIRPHALGRFRDVLGAVAKSPAMLLYLDNAQSVADSGRETAASAARGRRAARGLQGGPLRRARGLNENYARELLELHTLGVDGGYTQQDVIEVARALTGWTVQPPRQGGGAFLFRPEAHDAEAKTVLGHRLGAGRGIEDGEQVLDLVARHPSTARFIARKLAVRFVADEPPDDLVDRAAATFTKTDGDIRAVVRTIVTSPEFFSRAAYRSKVKSPYEVVVSALRALGARPDTTAFTASLVGRLGQPIYGHQAPDGWPETGGAWMNTGAILARINFGMAAAASRIPGATVRLWPGWDTLRTAPRERQVDAVISAFLRGAASPETREVLVSGRNPLAATDSSAMSFADSLDVMPDDAGADSSMSAGRRGARPNARPSTERGAPPALSGLAQIIGLALGAPEFQRR
jgi:uncharacterized protein (DUF1800 family)